MSVSRTGWTLVITGFTWMLVSMIAGFSLIGLEQIYGGIPVYCKSAHSHLATCSIILVAMGVAIALAGRYDVPLGLVTGDLAAVREAENLLGKIFTVAVKEATSRFAAKCLHPEVSHRLIRDAARKTVENINKISPYKPKVPIELKVEYHNSERADRISQRKNVKRIDGRTVLAKGYDMLEVYSLLIY